MTRPPSDPTPTNPASQRARDPMENRTYGEHGSYRREIGPRLGGEIDAARRRAGLTFREAAARIGVSAGYLCELTKGRRCPGTGVAEDIINVLPMTAGAAEELRDVAVERPVFTSAGWNS